MEEQETTHDQLPINSKNQMRYSNKHQYNPKRNQDDQQQSRSSLKQPDDNSRRSIKQDKKASNPGIMEEQSQRSSQLSGRKCHSKLSQNHDDQTFTEQNSYLKSEKESISKSKRREKKRGMRKQEQLKKLKIAKKEISQYDRLEEIRFQQYELAQNMKRINELVQENSPIEDDEDYFSANFLFTLPPEVWEEIKSLSKVTETNFESMIMQQDSLFENLSSKIILWKQRCYEFKAKITFLQSDSQLQSSDWAVREQEFQKSLKLMAKAYDKNRTQMFDAINDMELAVHDLKNAREKLNVKHLGNMNHVEKEMEDACNFLTNSGRIQRQQSARENGSSYITMGGELEKTTPRLSQPQKAPSGQNSKRGGAKSQSHRNDQNKVNIPPLPMDKLHRENSNPNGLGSKRPQLTKRNQEELQRLDSARQPSARIQSSRNGHSYRSNSQHRVTSCMANPVLAGAMPQGTSKFDPLLETQMSLDYRTERLRQYEDEYEFLMSLDDEDQKILVKQYIFMQHEKEILAQIKQEKKMRRKGKQEQMRQAMGNTTPRQQNPNTHRQNTTNNENEQTLKESSQDDDKYNHNHNKKKRAEEKKYSQDPNQNSGHMSDKKNKKIKNKGSGDIVGMDSILGVSNMSLHSLLSAKDTGNIDFIKSPDNFDDVQLTQILDAGCAMDDFGLKTVTEKELIDFYEIKLEREKQIHDEGRKVLGWSDGSTKHKQKSSRDMEKAYADVINDDDEEEQMVIDENNNKMFNNNAINIIDMNNDGVTKKKQIVGSFDFYQQDQDDNMSSSEDSSNYSGNVVLKHAMNQKANQQQPRQSPVYISQHIKNTIQSLHQQNNSNNDLSTQLSQKKTVSPYKEEVKMSERDKKMQHINSFRYRHHQMNSQQQSNSNIIEQDLSMMRVNSQDKSNKSYIQQEQVFQEEIGQVNGYKFENKMHSNRSKPKQDFNYNLNIDQSKDHKAPSIVQSARATPQGSSTKHKQQLQNHQVFCYGQNDEDNKIPKSKRSQSNKSNLQSAPNSQRNRNQHQKNNSSKDLIDQSNININNFYSIQVDDFENDMHINVQKNSYHQHKKSNSKSLINENNSQMPQYSFRDADTASFKKLNNKIQSRRSKHVSEKSGGIHQGDSEFSEESIRNIKGNIANNREELKQEEDIIQEKSFDHSVLENKTLLKSSSEILLRDSQRLYDLSDFGNQNNNQDRINFYFGQQTNEDDPHQVQYFTHESMNAPSSRQIFLPNNQDSSLKMGLINQFSSQNNQMLNFLNNRSQVSYDYLSNYLQHQTQGNFPGIQTRDVPTCKKRDARESGSLAFSFTASSNNTLYQFLQSNKKTLQMMQNFYNNFQHNVQAGVLFTMNASKDMNSQFLANCATVPSEPLFVHHTNDNTGNTATAFQSKNGLSLSRMALSTDESGGKLIGGIQQQNRISKQFTRGPIHLNNDQQMSNQKVTLDSGVNIRRILQNNNLGKGASTTMNQQSQNNTVQITNKIRTPNTNLNIKQQEATNTSSALINSQLSRGSSTRAGGNGASILFKGSQDLFNISPSGNKNMEKPSQVFNKNSKNMNTSQDQQQNYASFSQVVQQNQQSQNLKIKRECIKRHSLQKPVNGMREQDSSSMINYNSNQKLNNGNLIFDRYNDNQQTANKNIEDNSLFLQMIQSNKKYQANDKNRCDENQNLNL